MSEEIPPPKADFTARQVELLESIDRRLQRIYFIAQLISFVIVLVMTIGCLAALLGPTLHF